MKAIGDVMKNFNLGALRVVDEEEAQREREERARRLEDQAAEARRRALAALPDRGVPRKDLAVLLSGQSLLETTALRGARAFMAQNAKTMLVLAGSRGVGKTFTASWCCVQVPEAARFIDSARLMRVDRYRGKEMAALETCGLLVIDDLGMEYDDEKGAFLSKLDGLINARYAAELRTVITTNLEWKTDDPKKQDFRRRFGARIADRVREVGEWIGATGASLRGGSR